MKQKEKQLFKDLCKFKDAYLDEKNLEYASPHVLGQLFFNRMQGVAYGVLQQSGMLKKVNREFRNSLRAAYEQNMQKNSSFFACLSILSQILSESDRKVAMLKGAYLCAHYPDGYRTSNDIDLLVLPEDVTAIGDLLTKSGFKQGKVINDEFIPATRREIIESKMMRGETVPYIKKVDLPHIKYLEVDINFSLDYKNGDQKILYAILENVYLKEEKGICIPTLDKSDFFIHLCAHLYKEATTLPWIEMRRDMTLYKYCDIYFLLSEMTDDDIESVFDRAKELDMEKICAYAILETVNFFEMSKEKAVKMSKEVLSDDINFTLRVTSPKDKKTLIYRTPDVTKRFFMGNRAKNLKEVITDETS